MDEGKSSESMDRMLNRQEVRLAREHEGGGWNGGHQYLSAQGEGEGRGQGVLWLPAIVGIVVVDDRTDRSNNDDDGDSGDDDDDDDDNDNDDDDHDHDDNDNDNEHQNNNRDNDHDDEHDHGHWHADDEQVDNVCFSGNGCKRGNGARLEHYRRQYRQQYQRRSLERRCHSTDDNHRTERIVTGSHRYSASTFRPRLSSISAGILRPRQRRSVPRRSRPQDEDQGCVSSLSLRSSDLFSVENPRARAVSPCTRIVVYEGCAKNWKFQVHDARIGVRGYFGSRVIFRLRENELENVRLGTNFAGYELFANNWYLTHLRF